jgi:hypothetical protein
MSGRLTISPGWTTSGRNYSQEWIELPNHTGLYSPQNSAHFYPNNASYGSWRIAGTRNGWHGLSFDTNGGNGQVTLMVNTDANTTGFHNDNYGWQMRWNNGVGYIQQVQLFLTLTTTPATAHRSPVAVHLVLGVSISRAMLDRQQLKPNQVLLRFLLLLLLLDGFLLQTAQAALQIGIMYQTPDRVLEKYYYLETMQMVPVTVTTTTH